MKRAAIAALQSAVLIATVTSVSAVTAQTAASSDAPTRIFAPPEGVPMVLSRTVRRELSDGKAIVATRRYRVTFHRTADGWTIEGALVGSEIEAPQRLAMLADIERQRPDPGLFPIRLDAAGLIVPRGPAAGPAAGPADAMPPAAIDEAIRLITAHFPSAADAKTRETAIEQVRMLASQGTMSLWPRTLFLPQAGTVREERSLAVGDGIDGAIVTEFEQSPAERHAMMARAERRIETRIGDTRRIARETWTLAPTE